MGAMTSQITSLTVVYSIVYSGVDQWKHQNSASLAFVQGNLRWPVNSPHKWPVTRKMFPFDHWNGNVIILIKFSSLAALEVAILTTFSAASDDNFVKMTRFSFQWWRHHALLTPEVALITTSGIDSDKTDILSTFGFQCKNIKAICVHIYLHCVLVN